MFKAIKNEYKVPVSTKLCQDNVCEFKISDELTHRSFIALATNKIHAIRVKNFYPADVAKEICDRMLGSRLYGTYENAPMIGRIGQALFESQVSEETQKRYWNNAVAWTRELRQACKPLLTPIDKLRLELDEIWPSGATQGSIDGKRMFVGLARVFNPGSEAEPHQDILSWDLPKSADARTLRAQIAANTYLKMPPAGGELTLWPMSLSLEQYKSAQIPGSYGVDRSKISRPFACLTPEQGELILFNSQRVHAVETPERGPRITWSCFIGMRRHYQPLIMWS